MANLILPDDPEFKKPITMGNPYKADPNRDLHEQGITPGAKRAELEKQREIEANGNFKYASSSFVAAPEGWNYQMMKTSQAAGVSNMMTQPMWFTPLHTPQNWQIASKRREVYQWCHAPDTLILMADGTAKTIDKVVLGDHVISHTGKKRKVVNVGRRLIHEEVAEVYYSGISQPLVSTQNHKIFAACRKQIKELAEVIPSRRNHYGLHNYKDSVPESIEWTEIKDLNSGDLVFTPNINRKSKINYSGKFEWTIGKCEILGIYAAEGDLLWYSYKGIKKHPKAIRFTVGRTEVHFINRIKQLFNEEFNLQVKVYDYDKGAVSVVAYGVEVAHFFNEHVGSGCYDKNLSNILKQLPEKYISSFITGYITGNGSINKSDGIINSCISSEKLAHDLIYLYMVLNISFRYSNNVTNSTFSDKIHHIIEVQLNECIDLGVYKFNHSREEKTLYTKKSSRSWKTWFRVNLPEIGDCTSRRIRKINIIPYSGYVYNIEVEEDHSYVANWISVSNCRFFYENEPKVAAAIDFYSRFPMNGFNLECRNTKVLKFFEHHVAKKLNLNERLKEISSEYFMLGDVFIHTDISCPLCNGTAKNTDTGEECNHEGGMFNRIFVMNPDWVEVQKSPLTDEPLIVMIPDEELQQIVHKRQPKAIYDRIPDQLKGLIMARAPIPMSNRTTSHLRHMAVPYGTYGTSIIRRLFTTLAYKTKIMTANWIVAERLILPVRVVKVGSDNRPATSTDIADIQQQLAATANDPNLTIVTHHNFEYDWYGTCHDEKTEVLTSDGFKTYDQVDITQDKLMCYNVYTNKIECIYATEKQVYDYDGNMVSFNGRYLDILVTPNHKMLTFDRKGKPTVKRADQVQPNDRFTTIEKYDYGEKSEENIYLADLDFSVKTEELMKVIGYYLSEGYTTYTEDKYQYCTSISQHSVINNKYYREIKSSMNNVFSSHVTVHEYDCTDSEVKAFTLCNKKIANWFKNNFGRNSHSKFIPQWVKDLHPDYLKTLVRVMTNGDGSRQKFNKSTWSICGSVSEQLIDDMQEILFKCGFNSKKSTLPDRFTVAWTTGKNGTRPRLKDYHISTKHYKGKVWCFTTPTGFFVTRRNGKITIQGNSGKVLQITQEMEHIDKELLDGLMLNQALLNGEMCHSDDTEVLTDSGFKRYKNVCTDDKIACYNAYANHVEYDFPTALHEYDYDGELIHFSGKRLDIKVTPNHKMLVSWDKSLWKTTTADSVKNGMRFIGASEFENITDIQYPIIHNNDEYSVDLVEKFIPLSVFSKFAGYYISEGSSYAKKSNYHLHVYQSQKKAKIHKSIKLNFDDMGFNYSIYNYRDDGHDQFTINNKDFVLFMRKHFGHGSHFKCIPTWLKNIPKEYLETLLFALIEGDGSVRTTNLESYSYSSVSKQLIDDVQEIALKCGFSAKVWVQDKQCKSSFGKSARYWVHFSRGKNSNGSFPVVRKHNINKVPYKGKVWCFTTPTGFFVTRRNGKITVQSNSGYQSAQVGVETLIRRIESWRHSLAEWCEERVFRPIAEMQGFVDEEESEAVGETVFLYPRIKWNDLALKDKSQFHQLLTQLHDKQVISTQTLLEELDLDYDQEVMRMRYEQAQLGPAGASMGGAGGMGIGGDMGGMGGMPGGVASPAQGGGMDMGGDMGGGMGGGMDMSGGNPGGGAGAAPMAANGGKITKKGKNKQEEEIVIPTTPINLTKIEQKMRGMLEKVAGNMHFDLNNVRMQFPVENPHGGKPYTLDFALPAIKMGIETDGQTWHSNENQIKHDKERDYLLAQRGWTILRFDDKSIDEAPQQVEATVNSYIKKLMSNNKKASNGSSLRKISYFVCPDKSMEDLGSDSDKYYKYLSKTYTSRNCVYSGENIGYRSKEEGFETSRKI